MGQANGRKGRPREAARGVGSNGRPKRARKALLVAVEGIDGAGKTTLLALLADGLSSRGWKVGRWKEPSDSRLGQEARRISGASPAAAALLFTLDRGASSPDLQALRARSDVVLSDRSYFSTLAYQGSALGEREREALERFQASVAQRPDLVLWLAISPAVALGRVARRGLLRSPLERRTVLERTARAYARYAREERSRFVRLDARQDPERVATRALEAVLSRLPPSSRGPASSGGRSSAPLPSRGGARRAKGRARL